MRGTRHLGRTAVALLIAATVGLAAAPARAQESWLLATEGEVVMPLSEYQARVFGVGGSGAVTVLRSLTSYLLIGARLRAGVLSDGDAPREEGLADPGLGTFGMIGATVRLRMPAGADDPRRGEGGFVEVAGGGVLTSQRLRPGIDVGVGWGFEVGAVDIAPVVRWMHVFQPDDQLVGDDASLLLAGLEVIFFDSRPAAEPQPALAPVHDPDDLCPDEPEDEDGFEDGDGCPDPDNDRDSILDEVDECPLVPEDHDGFEDEDGCPDPDDDGDGILDVSDECPRDREVVNGVEDEDGCPDEGLIELVDDRIVLPERVLFDFDRAYVRPRAAPVLDAIATLWRQHPEWRRVRIEGHTDRRGTNRYNQELSTRRAQAVARELITRGMPADDLVAEGFGDTRPVTLGSSEASMQRNRRVEFVVIARVPVEEAR